MPVPSPLLPHDPSRRQTFLVTLLALLVIALAALIIWRTTSADETSTSDTVFADQAIAPKTVPPPKRSIDVDKLIAGYSNHQDYFQRLETATLAEYERTNPTDKPWYAEGRQAVRLFAAFAVWDDFYGQGVLSVAEGFASAACKKGCRDPLVSSICAVLLFQDRHSSNNRGAQEHIQNTRRMDASHYPALLRFVVTDVLLKNLTFTKANPGDLDDSLAPS